MKKQIILILTVSTLIISCSKEKAEQRECELQNISYIDIVNNDNEGYYMSIDGVFKQIINGDSYLNDYEVSAGTHTLKFEEINYILWPNIDEGAYYFGECDHKAISFGDNDPGK
ncbi:MAG: hypothetical protein HN535_04990 [Flavobacteriales bacterium]|nr:hypothetical protein [Flavobacteriales bacterium]